MMKRGAKQKVLVRWRNSHKIHCKVLSTTKSDSLKCPFLREEKKFRYKMSHFSIIASSYNIDKTKKSVFVLYRASISFCPVTFLGAV